MQLHTKPKYTHGSIIKTTMSILVYLKEIIVNVPYALPFYCLQKIPASGLRSSRVA